MKEVRSYGVRPHEQPNSPSCSFLEELKIIGFCVVPKVLDESQLSMARERLDSICMTQEKDIGINTLKIIDEVNLVRCPLVHDDFFLEIARNKRIVDIAMQAIGGSFVQLHLQNGIINRPNERHHQSSWHRDLPYQEFIISRPLAISALFCIDEFSELSGCTHVLPHSHQIEGMPSADYLAKFETAVTASAGDVIVFDAMLLHRAGYNTSQNVRRGLNHVFTTPILKQQISLPTALAGRHGTDPFLSKFLGYTSDASASITDYRLRRYERIMRERAVV